MLICSGEKMISLNSDNFSRLLIFLIKKSSMLAFPLVLEFPKKFVRSITEFGISVSIRSPLSLDLPYVLTGRGAPSSCGAPTPDYT